jgi:hypothetical protein
VEYLDPRKRSSGHLLIGRAACRPVSCIVSAVYEGASETIPLCPPDLSPAGRFIHASQFLPTGSVLKLRLLLSSREFLLRAEVRHCLPGQGVGVSAFLLCPKGNLVNSRRFQPTENGTNQTDQPRTGLTRMRRQNAPMVRPVYGNGRNALVPMSNPQ